jgi:hypothetical protein
MVVERECLLPGGGIGGGIEVEDQGAWRCRVAREDVGPNA